MGFAAGFAAGTAAGRNIVDAYRGSEQDARMKAYDEYAQKKRDLDLAASARGEKNAADEDAFIKGARTTYQSATTPNVDAPDGMVKPVDPVESHYQGLEAVAKYAAQAGRMDDFQEVMARQYKTGQQLAQRAYTQGLQQFDQAKGNYEVFAPMYDYWPDGNKLAGLKQTGVTMADVTDANGQTVKQPARLYEATFQGRDGKTFTTPINEGQIRDSLREMLNPGAAAKAQAEAAKFLWQENVKTANQVKVKNAERRLGDDMQTADNPDGTKQTYYRDESGMVRPLGGGGDGTTISTKDVARHKEIYGLVDKAVEQENAARALVPGSTPIQDANELKQMAAGLYQANKHIGMTDADAVEIALYQRRNPRSLKTVRAEDGRTTQVIEQRFPDGTSYKFLVPELPPQGAKSPPQGDKRPPQGQEKATDERGYPRVTAEQQRARNATQVKTLQDELSDAMALPDSPMKAEKVRGLEKEIAAAKVASPWAAASPRPAAVAGLTPRPTKPVPALGDPQAVPQAPAQQAPAQPAPPKPAPVDPQPPAAAGLADASTFQERRDAALSRVRSQNSAVDQVKASPQFKALEAKRIQAMRANDGRTVNSVVAQQKELLDKATTAQTIAPPTLANAR